MFYMKKHLNRAYNRGYQKAYEDLQRQTELTAKKALEELTEKYKSQFRFMENTMSPAHTIRVTDHVDHRGSQSIFYADIMSISFCIYPNEDGYAYYHSDKAVK